MPELPDVQCFKRYLDATALHQRIEEVHVADRRILAGVSRDRLARVLKGRRLVASRRHGKYLFIALDDGRFLVLHFGMTGSLRYRKKPQVDDAGALRHARLVLDFAGGGRLAFLNQRLLGRVRLVADHREFIRQQGLGPDALAIDYDDFAALLAGARGTIKYTLMDQKRLAGIGNVYADEILFQAGIHPATRVGDLDRNSRRRLWQVMRRVCATAIRRRANPARMPDDFLLPHRHDGGRCPGCGGPLAKKRIAGRSTYLCPRCQKLESMTEDGVARRLVS